MNRVLGVLAGTDMPLEQIGRWARSAEVVLAADGGANSLHDLGIDADAAIGDFDSIRQEARVRPATVVYNPDQDRSDCDKLLSFAIEKGYEAVTLCNVEGDLLDHVLATLHSAAKAAITVRVALRNGIGYILKGDCKLSLPAILEARLSLVPIEPCTRVFLEGVYWSLSGQNLAPTGRLSLSNKVTESTVTVQFDSGVAVLFLFGSEYSEPTW
jgi:thiamine pyrophosphokinase